MLYCTSLATLPWILFAFISLFIFISQTAGPRQRQARTVNDRERQRGGIRGRERKIRVVTRYELGAKATWRRCHSLPTGLIALPLALAKCGTSSPPTPAVLQQRTQYLLAGKLPNIATWQMPHWTPLSPLPHTPLGRNKPNNSNKNHLRN